MEKSRRTGLGTPLSTALREAYSATPKRHERKRKRSGSVRSTGSRRTDDTPKVIKHRAKKRKKDDGFEKPQYSIKDRLRKTKSTRQSGSKTPDPEMSVTYSNL